MRKKGDGREEVGDRSGEIGDRSGEIEVTGKKLQVRTRASGQLSSASRPLAIWGISATIGNLDQAKDVLLSPLSLIQNAADGLKPVIVKANLRKDISIESVIPEEIEKFPWAGHLGLNLAQEAVDIIRANKTTLVSINTRGMSER